MAKQRASDNLHIIAECMAALLSGPFLDEEEFSTRIGVEKGELSQIIQWWPTGDEDLELTARDFIPINNCMNEVCNGLIIRDEEWQAWFSVSKDEVQNVWDWWISSLGTVE